MPYCFDKFIGLGNKQDNYALGYAQVAENIDLSCGRLDPWRTPLLVDSVPDNAESIFLKNGKFRYATSRGVSVVHSLTGMEFISDPCDCIYFRKDWCEQDKRALGLPRPPEPIITPLSPLPTNDDCWKPELITAKITFESRCGHYKYESQPGPVSNQIKCSIDDEISIEIPAFDPGKYIIDTVCVYLSYTTWDVSQGLHGYPALGRNLQGRAPEVVDTNFETNVEIDCFKVAEITFDPQGNSLVITKDKCFGKTITTTGWRAPDPGMCLAGESDTGSLVAYDKKCLYFSVRNKPHAWRLADLMYFGSDIQFACHTNLTTYVFTKEGDLFIVQDDNDCTVKGSCRSVRHIQGIPKPCVDKFNANKAVLCGRWGVLYPSDCGIVQLTPDGGMSVVLNTDKGKFAWCNPISLTRYKDQVFINGFEYPMVMTVPLMFSRADQQGSLSTLSVCVKCWYESCGDLYALDFDGKIYKWDAGDECMRMRYKSTVVRIPGVTLNTMSLEYTEEYTGCGTVTLFKNNKPNQTKLISDCNPVKLPRISNAKTFCWEYNGEASVNRVCFGGSLQDISVAAAA